MYRMIIAARPYLIGVICFLVGAAIASLIWLKFNSNLAHDAYLNDVTEYANLLERIDLPPDAEDTLTAFVWDFAQNYAGLAGANFSDMSPHAREALMQAVIRIDHLAPQFAKIAQESRWGVYSAEEAATMRACILAAPGEDATDVQSCVRALQPTLFPESGTNRELAAR